MAIADHVPARPARRRQSKDSLERYDTRAWMTLALLRHSGPFHNWTIYEPCAGRGAMVDVFRRNGAHVIAHDIEPRRDDIGQADSLASTQVWPHSTAPDLVATNPPFSRATDLYRLWMKTRIPMLAMLLRLNWLERVQSRSDVEDPSSLIVLPRMRGYGFQGVNNDMVTVAWFVWRRLRMSQPPLPIARVSHATAARLIEDGKGFES